MINISKEERLLIVEKYNTGDYSPTRLAEEHTLKVRQIATILKTAKVLRNKFNRSKYCRKYNINHNYFDNLSTERQSYWLGMLYTDGCNSTENTNIRLSLQADDREIIEKFKNENDSKSIRDKRYLRWYGKSFKIYQRLLHYTR